MKNVFLSFIIISLFTLSCEKIWDATDSNQESSAERLVGKLPAMSFNKDTTACTKTGNAWAFILNNKVDSVWYITSYIADKNCVCVPGFYATKTKPVQKQKPVTINTVNTL